MIAVILTPAAVIALSGVLFVIEGAQKYAPNIVGDGCHPVKQGCPLLLSGYSGKKHIGFDLNTLQDVVADDDYDGAGGLHDSLGDGAKAIAIIFDSASFACMFPAAYYWQQKTYSDELTKGNSIFNP